MKSLSERVPGGVGIPAAVLAAGVLGAAAFVPRGGLPGRGLAASPLAARSLEFTEKVARMSSLAAPIAAMRGASLEAAAAGGAAADQEREAAGAFATSKPFGEVAAPKKIVREASLSLEVPDEPKARALARAAAARAGAALDGDSSAAGMGRCATLTFKVAPERFEALVAELEGLGRVTTRSMTSQNRGAEYVDLRSRLANLRRVEKRLHDLLSLRTQKLSDVLSVEKELERVGSEIETTEGRMKYIDALAASSTVTVTLAEPAKDEPRGGISVDIRNAFVAAVNTFVATGLALLKLTFWLAALALWVVPVSLGIWKLRNRAA